MGVQRKNITMSKKKNKTTIITAAIISFAMGFILIEIILGLIKENA